MLLTCGNGKPNKTLVQFGSILKMALCTFWGDTCLAKTKLQMARTGSL